MHCGWLILFFCILPSGHLQLKNKEWWRIRTHALTTKLSRHVSRHLPLGYKCTWRLLDPFLLYYTQFVLIVEKKIVEDSNLCPYQQSFPPSCMTLTTRPQAHTTVGRLFFYVFYQWVLIIEKKRVAGDSNLCPYHQPFPKGYETLTTRPQA